MRLMHAGLIVLVVASSVAGAQDPQRGRGRRGGPPPSDSFMPQDPAMRNMQGMARGQRAARHAIERVIRSQVQPTDAQMTQLRAIDAKFEPQRVKLVRAEMVVRRQLREAMLDSTNVDEARIGELLDQMVSFPGKRAAVFEAEQKELSTVLSPLQRAKYQAIQEHLRRRIEQGRGGPPGSRPPGER